MSLFLKRISFFSVIAIALLFVVDILYSNYSKTEVTASLSESTEAIIVGHSHPECAYNDSLLTDVKTLGSSGESYLYTKARTLLFIEQNPQVNSVFIEFTNNVITQRMDAWTWGDEYMTEKYPYLYFNISVSDKLYLLSRNASSYLNALSLSFQSGLVLGEKVFNNHPEIFGRYLHLKRFKADSLLKLEEQTSVDDKKNSYVNVSENNLQNLRELIDKLKSKNIKVFLVRSPLHPLWGHLANEKVFQQIKDSLFVDVPFLDFHQFDLPVSHFGDLHHLNYKGAKIYSRWFNQLWKQKIFDRDNHQPLIDSMMVDFYDKNPNLYTN